MTAGRPSWTAELMALFRALESSRPPAVRLFDDPFAEQFLGVPFRLVLALARIPGGLATITAIIERRWGGPFGSGVCRTRYIDDALRAMLVQGVSQVVILGAGFDARGYRIPGIERTRVFEVDHPATQASKKERLVHVLGHLPAHVAFVPIDFDRERLEDAMARAGLRADARTFFLWEGVTNYLSAHAVDATVRSVARAGAVGSELVFTYVHRGILDGSVRFEGADEGTTTVRRAGEPFTFGLDPATIAAYLAARGLELVEDVGAPEYRSRYLRPLGRDMKFWEFYRAVRSRIGAIRVRPAREGDIACCHDIRREVFIAEQGVSVDEEMDGHDPASAHFLALQADEVIGTARLRPLPDGTLKAERVAVRAPFRRRGVGRALMGALEDAARERGDLVLNAQTAVVPFYERLGYRCEGPEFVEAGIPHRAMRKRLSVI